MSDPNYISPLLDGFVVGDPISNHDGVRCCPAMRENSDEKYIVKIISIPPTQKQLDALLLTGAFADAASATGYFKETADEVVKEAEILKQLSKLDGFLPYTDWQVVPMQNNQLGYEIYLVSPYKRSLEKHLRRNTMTHLGAVNLGLDLCAALSICRRAGFMYVDLKPTNIYLSGKRGFRIGDLGFVSLKSLKYSSLPGKYRSRYSAPELHDPLATLNPTADIYSVGMILYQIYNNGELPFADHAPAKALPAPMNADYEMAEIIAKALNPNPRKRWQTPIEMGQALVSYMQRNTINDTPIVPPSAKPEPISPPDGSAQAGTDSSEAAQISDPVSGETQADAAVSDELAFLNDMVSDETAPDADGGEDVADGAMTDEVSRMLAQADELLLAQQDFEPIAVPDAEPEIREPVFSVPNRTVAAEQPRADDDDFPPIVHNTTEDDYLDDDFDDLDFGSLLDPDGSAAARGQKPVQPQEPDDDRDFAVRHRRKKRNPVVAWLITILLLALLGAGGFFLKVYYLLPIDNMEIFGSRDTVTVLVTTDADESLLSVLCTDTNGNISSVKLSGGKAVFTGLDPSTTYKFSLEADGFHGLFGVKPCSYTTIAQTKISDFSAKAGDEDGSIILNFSVTGPEQEWMVEYTAEGEEPNSVSFTGHTVTIQGLSVGKTYSFKLVSPVEDLWITGNTALDFLASKIIVAENLCVVSLIDNVLTVQWDTPKNMAVDGWSVRCYAEQGYDETIFVVNNEAQFTNIDASTAYTVEVTASGMSQSARTYVTANSMTLTSLSVKTSQTDRNALDVTWKYEGTAPAGGWLMTYSSGADEEPTVVSCKSNTGMIPSKVPGSTYHVTIQAADGSTVFGGKTSYDTHKAKDFNSLSVDSSQLQVSLCPTPSKSGWTYKDISKDAYRSVFTATEKASLVLYTPKKPAGSSTKTEVMIVVRDDAGNPVLSTYKISTIRWNELWKNQSQYCTLDIPALPSKPGNYTVEVYFGGDHVTSKPLTITE